MSPGFEVPNPIHVCIQVPPPSSHPGPILSIDQPSLQILRSQPNPCLYSGPIPITSRALWVLSIDQPSLQLLRCQTQSMSWYRHPGLRKRGLDFLPFYPGPDLEISGSGFRSHRPHIERAPWILTKPSVQLLRSQTHPCLNTKIPGSGQMAGFLTLSLFSVTIRGPQTRIQVSSPPTPHPKHQPTHSNFYFF